MNADLCPRVGTEDDQAQARGGERVPAHSHPTQEIVFHLVEGAIESAFGDRTLELDTGDVARFDGDQETTPRAVERSTALIVLASRSED